MGVVGAVCVSDGDGTLALAFLKASVYLSAVKKKNPHAQALGSMKKRLSKEERAARAERMRAVGKANSKTK